MTTQRVEGLTLYGSSSTPLRVTGKQEAQINEPIAKKIQEIFATAIFQKQIKKAIKENTKSRKTANPDKFTLDFSVTQTKLKVNLVLKKTGAGVAKISYSFADQALSLDRLNSLKAERAEHKKIKKKSNEIIQLANSLYGQGSRRKPNRFSQSPMPYTMGSAASSVQQTYQNLKSTKAELKGAQLSKKDLKTLQTRVTEIERAIRTLQQSLPEGQRGDEIPLYDKNTHPKQFEKKGLLERLKKAKECLVALGIGIQAYNAHLNQEVARLTQENERLTAENQGLNLANVELTGQVEGLTQRHDAQMQELREQHQLATQALNQEHTTALDTQRQELETQHQLATQTLAQEHTAALDTQRQELETQHQLATQTLAQQHAAALETRTQELNEQHQLATQALNQEHTTALATQRQQLEAQHQLATQTLTQQHTTALATQRQELEAQHQLATQTLNQEHTTALETQRQQLEAQHQLATQTLNQEHTTALATQRQELETQHQLATQALNQEHTTALETQRQQHAATIKELEETAAAEQQKAETQIQALTTLKEKNNETIGKLTEATVQLSQRNKKIKEKAAELKQKLKTTEAEQQRDHEQLLALTAQTQELGAQVTTLTEEVEGLEMDLVISEIARNQLLAQQRRAEEAHRRREEEKQARLREIEAQEAAKMEAKRFELERQQQTASSSSMVISSSSETATIDGHADELQGATEAIQSIQSEFLRHEAVLRDHEFTLDLKDDRLSIFRKNQQLASISDLRYTEAPVDTQALSDGTAVQRSMAMLVGSISEPGKTTQPLLIGPKPKGRISPLETTLHMLKTEILKEIQKHLSSPASKPWNTWINPTYGSYKALIEWRQQILGTGKYKQLGSASERISKALEEFSSATQTQNKQEIAKKRKELNNLIFELIIKPISSENLKKAWELKLKIEAFKDTKTTILISGKKQEITVGELFKDYRENMEAFIREMNTLLNQVSVYLPK